VSLQGPLEGLRSLTERHEHGLKAIMEQMRELAQRLPLTNPNHPVILHLSVVSVYSPSRLPENSAYLLWSDIQGILVPAGVLTQCSLISELEPSSFP
jgi:alpha-amylase/alpha-mannosidase (GH57 family)